MRVVMSRFDGPDPLQARDPSSNPFAQAAGRDPNRSLARVDWKHHLESAKGMAMLDFSNDTPGNLPSPQAGSDAPASDQVLLHDYSNSVIAVTERVGPAVVRVETGSKEANGRGRGGLGSGIVISPDGLVLTNSHVVGSSRQIRLRDIEGVVTDARVLGVDADTDLALLRA